MKNKTITIIVFLAVLAINLAFGLPRLSRYSAVDEPYWTYDRTSQFWESIAERKWRSTNVNDKPGITVAILSGLGLTQVDPMQFKSIRDEIKTFDQIESIRKINFFLRLPIYLFSLLMLWSFFILLKKLFDERIALFSIIFIGLSPIILGISLIINPDSLLWIFLPLSILSYLVFQKEQRRKYLIWSGIFLGLSLLTKYVANILYIYFLVLIFFEYVYSTSVKEKEAVLKYLKKALLEYAIIVGISMATFFILFPAVWVHPQMLLKGTFLSKAFESTWSLFAVLFGLIMADALILKGKAAKWLTDRFDHYKIALLKLTSLIFLLAVAFVLLNTYLGMKFYDFERILASPKAGTDNPFVLAFFSKIFLRIYMP
jgi:uncharacterized membrane protein